MAASAGVSPAPQHLARAVAGGAVPVASRLPVYEEVLADGERGLLFEPRDSLTLASQMERLVTDEGLRERLHSHCAEARQEFTWSATADAIEEVYRQIAARRHDPDGKPAVRKRLGSRDFIHVDLHMHTDHSPDCATEVETLLDSAKRAGLGAIAITDHNEVSGALEARERANGIKVIVAEEVKTADQGEVIGLFLEDKIPRGMSLEETIAEIRRQGGLVYVPHPFDPTRHCLREDALVALADGGLIDAIEVFNAKTSLPHLNERARAFAAERGLPGGAGSDAHEPSAIGAAYLEMPDFDGPADFLARMAEGEVVGHAYDRPRAWRARVVPSTKAL